MKRICSWCQLVMSQGTGPDPEVTHGICIDCFQTWMGGLGQITSGNGRFTMVFGRR